VGNIVGINLEFTKSSLCLVHFSSDGRDGSDMRAVDGETYTVLVDEACMPVDIDMTLSVIRSIRTSSTTLSVMLNSFDIHTRGWKSQVQRVT
jgi:hypothetical protein